MENHRTLVSNNWMNGLFAMLQQKFPANIYVSTHAFMSKKKLATFISQTQKTVYFPVNHNLHWALLIYFPKTMEWKYYDSYGKQTSAETIMFEHISQTLHELFPKSLKLSGTIFSHQQNSWDCGYYVCIYASLLSLDCDLDLNKFTFKSYFANLRYFMIRNVWAFIAKDGESDQEFSQIIEQFFKNPEEVRVGRKPILLSA